MESDGEKAETAKLRDDFWKDPRPTNENPNFVRDYFASSRLHFIGSFRARYESMMVAVGQKLGVNPAELLRSSAEKGLISSKRCPSERVIVHIDMDCFFASVAIKKNPSLAGKCIAVAHGGGEISSCSYEARKYGVRAGMFCRDAMKLCPELLSVPYDFPMYEEVSIQIYARFYDYPGVSVEAVSVDEAYLDVTLAVGDDHDGSQSGAEALVQNLRSRIHTDTGCTASAGIGPSKLIARLATKKAKPNGQLRIRQDGVIAYLDTLKVKDLPGIGWSTGKRLSERGVTTCRELRAIPLATLQSDFGDRQGQVFFDLARALDARPVEPLKPRKSIGAEASWGVRFEQGEDEKVRKFISDMADEVATRVSAVGAHGTKVTFKLYKRKPDASMVGYKHLGHGPCTILSRSGKIPAASSSHSLKQYLQEACLRIHEELGTRNEDVRGIGVQMTDLAFAALNCDYTLAPTVRSTKRIESFFGARPSLYKIQNADPDVSTVEEAVAHVTHDASDTAKVGGRVKNGESVVATCEQDGPFERATVILDAERSSDEDRIERGRANSPPRRVPSSRRDMTAKVPPGWDKDVFCALPNELQQELLLERELPPIGRSEGSDRADDGHEEADIEVAEQIKRKKLPRRRAVAALEQSSNRKRRKTGAQVTMTQFADISELRTKGNEVLDADEFRERPLKDCLELLEDFRNKGRGGHASRGTVRGPERDLTGRRKKATLNRCNERPSSEDGHPRHKTWDIPSPPSLSSDSESSGGVGAALDHYGLDDMNVYEDESVLDYAGKLKAWMTLNASNVKSAHVELLRGRVLDLVRRKKLERVCTEMGTIGRFAELLGGDGWRRCFEELVEDVQAESTRLHGFRLVIRRLCERIRR